MAAQHRHGTIKIMMEEIVKTETLKQTKVYHALCNLWMKKARMEDRKLGVDFAAWVENSASLHGNKYQPSTDGLKKVLDKLPVKDTDVIVDIGCGKGKAMYLMSHFPFAYIDGIEFSNDLVKVAQENFKTLQLPQCTAMQADAAEFERYDDCNYFYIFNSFPRAVFRKMLNHILYSLAKNPRKIYFIYLNPVCHDMLMETGVFKLLFRKRHLIRWFQYYCYTNMEGTNG